MAAYATKADMIKRYDETSLIELTDRVEVASGVINDDVLNAALDDASAEIDTYLARRYKTPVVNGNAVLKRLCLSIAYYFLHRDNYPDPVRQAYDDAISHLNKISKGDAVLDLVGLEPDSSAAQAIVAGPARMFSRETMKDM